MAATIEIRKENRSNVYKYIYTAKKCSKQDIVTNLSLSLPTTVQNINELLSAGLVKSSGFSQSTGGRKPEIFETVPDARVAVGVEIMTDYVFVVLVDLYGNILQSKTRKINYSNDENYFSCMGKFINDFVRKINFKEDQLLGIAVAVQGITSPDNLVITYSRILNNVGLASKEVEKYIGYPCILLHDSKTAAFAESFHRPNLQDTCYILLNNNLGSALIMDRNIYKGNHSRGQVVEHMCIVPDGEVCYCGKKGCAEKYCSASSLEEKAGESLDLFFNNLRSGQKKEIEVWNDYLNHFATLLYNVLMTLDVDIIIGGKLRRYMTLEDVEDIKKLIRERSDFEIADSALQLEHTSEHPAALGAALKLIKDFLDNY